MTPTQEISTHMAQDAIWAKFQPHSYRKWKQNVEAARERARKYKEKSCRQ